MARNLLRAVCWLGAMLMTAKWVHGDIGDASAWPVGILVGIALILEDHA